MSAALSGLCATARIPRPGSGAVHIEVEADHHQDRREDHDDVLVGQRGVADVDPRLVRKDVWIAADQPAERQPEDLGEDYAEDLLQDERDADRGDQEDQRWRVLFPKRAVRHPFDNQRRAAGRDRGRDEADQDGEQRHRHRRGTLHAEHGPRAEHCPRSHHEDLGVGEVDQFQHPVDQRVPEGDERVDGALRQPVDGVLSEIGDQVVHGGSKYDGVRPETMPPPAPYCQAQLLGISWSATIWPAFTT
jgi:hypothetical protein